MLDAHQLNIFLTAAETLNFTKAADQLHMSQPSVSQHIRALEKHFDTNLFIRQGRSLSLSDAGRTLIPMARQFVKQSTCIDEAMSSLKGQIQGRICIACNAPAGRYILPEYFSRFHRQHPDVNIVCETETCDLPHDLLQKGTTHFVVTNQPNGLAPGMSYQEIFMEDICLITPLDHPWAERGVVEIDQLAEESFILPNENSLTYQLINAQLAEQGTSLRQLDPFLTLGNPEAIIITVEKGLGVGFASRVITNHLARVACVEIKDTQISRPVTIAHDANQPSTAARKAFWDFMVRISKSIEL